MDTQLRNMERYCVANPTDWDAAFRFELRKWAAGIFPNKFDWGCAGCGKFSDVPGTQMTPIVNRTWWTGLPRDHRIICEVCNERFLELTRHAKDPVQFGYDYWKETDALTARFCNIKYEWNCETTYWYERWDEVSTDYRWEATDTEINRSGDAIRPEDIPDDEWYAIKDHAARTETYMFFNSLL